MLKVRVYSAHDTPAFGEGGYVLYVLWGGGEGMTRDSVFSFVIFLSVPEIMLRMLWTTCAEE